MLEGCEGLKTVILHVSFLCAREITLVAVERHFATGNKLAATGDLRDRLCSCLRWGRGLENVFLHHRLCKMKAPVAFER